MSNNTCPITTADIPDDVIDITILNENQAKEINWMENVLNSNSNDRKSWSSYHSNKEQNNVPLPCNSCIFPLLKDVVHTLNMQHHLISLCVEYTRTLNPEQVTAVDCSDQPIYALSKIIQWTIPHKFSFPNYFPIFGCLHIEKALLISNEHLVRGIGLNDILGDSSIDTIGLQTTSVDVNHIHKARYSVQLSIVAMYACLKEAHAQSQTELSLFSWADEIAKTNIMFEYCYLILQFQTDYLVFIRSLRKGNFKLF